MTRDTTLVGQLLETFVATELRPHLETVSQRTEMFHFRDLLKDVRDHYRTSGVSQRTEMFHFRDRSGRETDFLLERQGRLVGLEVRSSTSVNRNDTTTNGDSYLSPPIKRTLATRVPAALSYRPWRTSLSRILNTGE